MAEALPLEEAQARLLALASPLPIERVDVAGALGRYLAEPLTARRTQPAADVSAMDGYAVAADDLAGPWRVIGESAAGHPFAGKIGAGEAARISTGAMVPGGAGAVIVQEDVTRAGDIVTFTGTAPEPPDRHIRPAAMDFAAGAALAAAGTRVRPALIGLALTAGHTHLAVRRPPRLAIIDSGDELAEAPDRCPPHQIPASNAAMLAAQAADVPCAVTRTGPVADRLDALLAAFESAADADVIVTSGGASVGDHDLIRPALEAWGARLDFWRVAIKPGKPLLVATRGAQVVLGLPGNPTSAFVTAHFFLLPLLRALLGAGDPTPRPMIARLVSALPAGGPRREFLRARRQGPTVVPEAMQDSGALAALARANALIDRPADAPAAAAGDEVSIYPLRNGGDA
ncbi:MAG: molybdopterin molybdotransferase MoeA [Novosphingobium sp.]